MKKLTLLIIGLFLLGCETSNIANTETPVSISQADLGADTGIVVGTYTRTLNKKHYSHRRFFFQNIDTKQKYTIRSRSTFNPLKRDTNIHHFTDKESEGDVFAFVLPAGKYHFYNFQIHHSTVSSDESWFAKQPYSIVFDVQPNKVNYLGEVRFTSKENINLIGNISRDGGFWVIHDNKDRDMPLINRQYPNISLNNVVTIIPTSKAVFTPFVLLPSELGD